MAFRNPDTVAVADDVAAGVERVGAALRFHFPPVADGFSVAANLTRTGLFEHRVERQVDTVWLALVLAQVTELVGDEAPTSEHGRIVV